MGEIMDTMDIPKHNKSSLHQANNQHQLNVEKLKAISLKQESRQSCSLSPCLFTMVLEALAEAIKQLKEIREHKLKRQKSKYHYLHMIDSIHKQLQKVYQGIFTANTYL